MSLACSVAIKVFTLHSEHVRIAILSGFQLVWSSELMVILTFYIVVAMRDCEIWQFPVWSSFTYYKSTRKKRAEYERKISFFNGEQSVMYKKRIHTLWNMNTKRNKTKSMFCLKMYSDSVFQDEKLYAWLLQIL